MANDEFTLVSPAIDNDRGGKLPRYCTQEGLGAKWDISPPLEWHNVPSKTKSLALMVQDVDNVDATGRKVPFTHWVVVNIPVTVKRLPEGLSGKVEEEGGEYVGIKEGINDWKVNVWRGPKIDKYGDRFEFRLYAISEDRHFDNQCHFPIGLGQENMTGSGTGDLSPVTKEKVLDTITGHVLGEALLTATF